MPHCILVTDTNIWIDLHRANLLVPVFQLPFQFVTTDFVIAELHQPQGKVLEAMGLQVESFESEDVLALYQLRQTLGNPSLADMSCYFLAREKGWTLLTNDKQLRTSGQKTGMDVHGSLWLLDQLESCRLLKPSLLLLSLETMLAADARLPEEECKVRLKRWQDC